MCLAGIAGVSWQMIEVAMPDASANERRCATLQRDMLSAKPRRADSAALFEALKCNPKGRGQVAF